MSGNSLGFCGFLFGTDSDLGSEVFGWCNVFFFWLLRAELQMLFFYCVWFEFIRLLIFTFCFPLSSEWECLWIRSLFFVFDFD